MVQIVREILSRQSLLFVEVLTIMQINVSKGSERESKKLMQMEIWKTNVWNARLANDLDADLKIT